MSLLEQREQHEDMIAYHAEFFIDIIPICLRSIHTCRYPWQLYVKETNEVRLLTY